MRFFSLFLSLMFLCHAPAAFGQAIVLRPDDVLPKLKEASNAAFYINGPMVHGLSDEMAADYYRLDGVSKYALALITLRLADRGLIDLNEPVAKALPDLMDFNPFEVAITPNHLLAETGGFAHAPEGLGETAHTAPLSYFLIKSRGAGQLDDDDPVGWHVLKSLLERRSGQSLQTLLLQEVLSPLGIADQSMLTGTQEPYWHTPLSSARIQGMALQAFFEPLIHNPIIDGKPYLKTESYKELVSTPLWEMHPLGHARMAGLRLERMENHEILAIAATGQNQDISIMVLPHSGLVFLQLGNQGDEPRFMDAVHSILHEEVPPTYDHQAAIARARQLVPPSEYGRFYICAHTPSDLATRIKNVDTCQMRLRPTGRGFDVTARTQGSGVSYTATEVAPFYFQPESSGEPLVFSTYKAGGYAALGQNSFVKAGVLGQWRGHIGGYIPVMLLVLLTGALHIGSKTSVQWRRFGWFCLIGPALVGGGLYADWHWWASVLYEHQLPALITAWRTGLNLGLMLLLALPMLAMTFVRQQNMPQSGLALLLAGPHLGLISLAALALFLSSIIWGMAGTFTAY